MSDMKRFEVTIERHVLVYAPTPEEASTKALDALGFRKKPGLAESIPARVIAAIELPALVDEPRMPIIDRAPGMQK